MRKQVFGRKLSRSRKSRVALFRSLIKALIVNGKITTTKAKTKAIQGQADKIITIAKKADLSARRKALALLGNDRKVNDFLFSKIGPLFKNRQSGFTRMILLPRRRGDNAEMATLEWVEKYVEEVKKQELVKKKTKTKIESKKVLDNKSEKKVTEKKA